MRSVAFQPVTHSGRHPEFDPLTRLTNSDVIALLADQRPDWFRRDDFFPVPCCFPACRSVTYLLTEGTPGQPGFALAPVPRLLQVEDYLDYVPGRLPPAPGCQVRSASAMATPSGSRSRTSAWTR